MSLCPINLECLEKDKYCPNTNHCRNLAYPWQIPYSFDCWNNPGFLEVWNVPFVELPTEYDLNYDHEIQAYEDYVTSTKRRIQEYHDAGWANSIWLPYFWDDQQKALVVWDTEHKEGFYPAVPLSKRPNVEDLSFYLAHDSEFCGWIFLEELERWEWSHQNKAYCDPDGHCFQFVNERESLKRFVRSFQGESENDEF